MTGRPVQSPIATWACRRATESGCQLRCQAASLVWLKRLMSGSWQQRSSVRSSSSSEGLYLEKSSS